MRTRRPYGPRLRDRGSDEVSSLFFFFLFLPTSALIVSDTVRDTDRFFARGKNRIECFSRETILESDRRMFKVATHYGNREVEI